MANPIWVRATIKLPGVDRNQVVRADGDDEWVQDNIRSGYLIVLERPPKDRRY